jgi:hypothetical protein
MGGSQSATSAEPVSYLSQNRPVMSKRITLTPAQVEYYEALLQLVRELRARERELRSIRDGDPIRGHR